MISWNRRERLGKEYENTRGFNEAQKGSTAQIRIVLKKRKEARKQKRHEIMERRNRENENLRGCKENEGKIG